MKRYALLLIACFCLTPLGALASQDVSLPGLHPDGPVGMWRIYSGQRRASGPTALGISISASYFNLDDFPANGTDSERLAGKAALSYTPLRFWEIFVAGSALTNNENSAATLVQQVGNVDFGTKLAFDLKGGWSLGALAAGRYRRSAMDLGYTGTALSWDAMTVATYDLLPAGIPLRFHANAGFRFDQTDRVLPSAAPEAARILLGVNGYNSVLAGLGIEVPLSPVVFSAEYTMEVAADAPGVGFFDNPQRATLGLRYFPSKDRTWAIGFASDLGFFAAHGASRIVKEPDYSFHGGLIFHFAKPGSRVEALPAQTQSDSFDTYVFGKVTDARTSHPVGGAVISLCGRDISALVSDLNDGLYRSYNLRPGDCNITVTAKGYAPISQVVRIPDTGNLQQDFVLSPSEPERGIVVVRVKNAKGEPTKARMSLPDVPTAKSMETDEEGRLRIKLPVSTYLVRAEGPAGTFSNATVDVVDGSEVYAEFVLQPGATDAYLDGSLISVVRPIQFATGSDVIVEVSKKTLKDVVKILQANPRIKTIEVAGHTDSSGNDDLNLRVSRKRAQSVTNYLVSLGIQKNRLNPVGYGETRPIADNKTKKGREANRRVEFKILP